MSRNTASDFGCLPEGWTVKTVSYLIEHEILERPMDGNHGGKHPKGSDYVEDGIPFIMATDINDGQIDFDDCKYISKQLADTLDKGFSNTGDVLLTHKASLGRTAIVGRLSTPYIMLTPQVTYYRIKNKGKISNAFLKYYFDSPLFQEILINHGDSGSTRAYIGITAQKDLPILLIPLPEQNKITILLSSLDDKISLLQRQNKTLEAIAETLFRQWFIEEADAGWEEVPLAHFADNIRDNVKAEDLSNYENYVGLEHIPRKRIILDSWSDTRSIESNKSSFKKYDILFGKLRSYFHKVVCTPIEGICSTDILVIRPKKVQWLPFCLFWFFSKDVVDHSDLGSGGTRMPRTSWEIVSSYKVPCPPAELIIEFDKIVWPSLSKMFLNIDTICTLKKLRDTLLPQLMSGKMRIDV